MATRDQSWLSRMERRLLYLFGPADVKAADSRRPVPPPPPPPTGPVITGSTVVRDEPVDPGASGARGT